MFGQRLIRRHDSDLTAQHAVEPLRGRILVHGRVLDEDGGPVGGALVGQLSQVTAHLTGAEIDQLLDPCAYLARAQRFISKVMGEADADV